MSSTQQRVAVAGSGVHSGVRCHVPVLSRYRLRMKQVSARANQRGRIGFRWLCFFFVAIAYQKPLAYVTAHDRTNPRLFDLAFLLAAIFVLPNLPKVRRIPRFFKVYCAIIISFSISALIYAVGILPWSVAGKYSLFFAARDWQALLLLYMAIQIPLEPNDKKKLLCLIVGMGVFTTAYCIPEYLNPMTSVQVRDDLTVGVTEGILVGPFGGAAYFKVAMYSSLYFIVTMSLAVSAGKAAKRQLLFTLAGFLALPVLFSGSRSGVAFLVVSMVAFGFLYVRSRVSWSANRIFALTFICMLLLGGARFMKKVDSVTLRRLSTLEESENSIASRLSLVTRFAEKEYVYQAYVPLIGAGYGVAPVEESISSERYRIGYGFHQTFLKNYEQGGIVPFVLFFVFLWYCFKSVVQSTKTANPLDACFAMAILAFFFANLVNSFVGNSMWYGVSGAFFLYLIHLASLQRKPVIGAGRKVA